MKSLQPTRFRGRSRPDLTADAPKKFKIVQPVTGQNPTENYRGTSTTYANALGYLYHGKPWFTYFDIPLMMRDSWIRFLATLWTSPFSQIEFEVRATSPDVEGYVRRALTQFQKKSAPSLLRSYFFWGFAPGGIEWERKGGNRSNVARWHIDKVRRVFPQDAKPLVWANSRRFAGFQTNTTGKVLSPYAFWFAGFEEAGPLHDDPPVSGAYDDWKEYTSRGGARHNQLIFHRRCAVRPSTMYYPPGQTPISGSDGEVPERIDNQTLALATSEQIESGANVVLPDVRTEQGDRRWELVPATPNPDAPGIREYPEWLKKNMAAGVGIPIEVVQAAESGSGWSGRKVPYKAWLSSVDSIAGLFYDTFDIQGLRQGVHETFGPKADYEFACKSLVEKVDAEGDGEGDPKMGGQPGGGGPTGGASPGMEPYHGPKGGNGYKNPQTGRVRYMGGLWQRSGEYADSVMKLEERQRLRKQVRMSAAFVEGDHPRDDGGQFAEKFNRAVKKKDHLAAHELTNAALDGHHGEDVRAKVSAALDHNLRERGDTKHRHDSISKSLAGKLELGSDTVKGGKRLKKTAGTPSRSAEESLRNLVSYYAGTEGKAKSGKADDFVSVIKYMGGIHPDDSEMKAAYGSMKGAIEDGIPLAVFNKLQKSRLDEISDTLVNDGTIQLPSGRNGSDYLLELIKGRVKAGWFDAQHEQDQAEEAFLLAEMEAKHGTNDPAELVEALRRGEADARREVTDEFLGEYAQEPERGDSGDADEPDPADEWDRGGDDDGADVERDFLDFTEDPEEAAMVRMSQAGLFDEVDHPRATDGKFTEKAGGPALQKKADDAGDNKPASKEPHEMRLEDYAGIKIHPLDASKFQSAAFPGGDGEFSRRFSTAQSAADAAAKEHRNIIKVALKAGKHVPPEVMLDHFDDPDPDALSMKDLKPDPHEGLAKLQRAGKGTYTTEKGKTFEIRHKEFGGAHGYAVFVDGKRKTAYKMMSDNRVENWLDWLKESPLSPASPLPDDPVEPTAPEPDEMSKFIRRESERHHPDAQVSATRDKSVDKFAEKAGGPALQKKADGGKSRKKAKDEPATEPDESDTPAKKTASKQPHEMTKKERFEKAHADEIGRLVAVMGGPRWAESHEGKKFLAERERKGVNYGTDKSGDKTEWGGMVEAWHKSEIADAETAGKPVPDHVLNDYPELAAKQSEESEPHEGLAKLKSAGKGTYTTEKGKTFEIRHKTFGGAHGYAVFVDGKRKTAYKMMSDNRMENWLDSLKAE